MTTQSAVELEVRPSALDYSTLLQGFQAHKLVLKEKKFANVLISFTIIV